MAEVNALLDLAAPALREALLMAFLDRLSRPTPPPCLGWRRMSALAGLVERGLVAPDWAEALAPVDEQIAAMGEFLRAEIAAGRSYLPHGDQVLRAFSRPLADVRVLVVGPGPLPDARAPGRAVVLGRARRPAAAEEPGQHLQRARRRRRLRAADATAT